MNKNFFSKTKKGFSIMELMMVVFIFTIMTGVLFVSNRKNTQAKRDVDIATRQIVAFIRETQNIALTGKQILIGTDWKSVCGVGVYWNSNEFKSYYIQDNDEADSSSDCRADNKYVDGDKIFGNTVSFVSGTKNPVKNVIITENNEYVFFKLPYAKMTKSDSGEYQKIVVTSSIDPTVKKAICIYGNSIEDKAGDDC